MTITMKTGNHTFFELQFFFLFLFYYFFCSITPSLTYLPQPVPKSTYLFLHFLHLSLEVGSVRTKKILFLYKVLYIGKVPPIIHRTFHQKNSSMTQAIKQIHLNCNAKRNKILEIIYKETLMFELTVGCSRCTWACRLTQSSGRSGCDPTCLGVCGPTPPDRRHSWW